MALPDPYTVVQPKIPATIGSLMGFFVCNDSNQFDQTNDGVISQTDIERLCISEGFDDIRFITNEMAITLDFNAQRMNVAIASTGEIIDIFIG